MAKKKHKCPERADQCVTLADKIAFSLMVRSKIEALQGDPWAGPEQFSDLWDQYGTDYESYPWCHPEWAANYARAEEEKERVLRSVARDEKRQANRRLYGKIK
jgi:hypothetical protein